MLYYVETMNYNSTLYNKVQYIFLLYIYIPIIKPIIVIHYKLNIIFNINVIFNIIINHDIKVCCIPKCLYIYY